jgi:hypothetical protein
MESQVTAMDLERIRKAADNGDPDAQYQLGCYYNKGELVPKDNRQAIAWLQRATEQEHLGATALLAHLYEYGEGVARDLREALRLYQRAAAAGSEFSRDKVQQLTRQLEPQHSAEPTDESDINVAALREAAEQGDAQAQQLQAAAVARFDDAIVRLAVRAYVLSIPFLGNENALIPLIAANRADFVEGGKAIEFMRAAGTALAQRAAAYNGPSAQQIFGGFMPAGLAHLPGQVDAAMGSEGTAVGNEFLWLAQVLPAAATGDYGPYQNTATPMRRQIIAYIQMISQMNPALVQMIVSAMQTQQSVIEAAIYNLVCQLGI